MPDAFDDAALERLYHDLGDDAASVNELIRTYLSEASGLVRKIKESLQHHEASEFTRAAHSLKSTSATFGATELASLAQELELMGRAGNLDDAEPRSSRVPHLFAAVERHLVEWAATHA